MVAVDVEPLLPAAMDTILERACLQACTCYRVAFDLVVGRKLAERYVLGFAAHLDDNIKTPHAWIRLSEGHYADPLLQHTGKLTKTKYYSVHEFAREQTLELLHNHLGSDFRKFLDGQLDSLLPSIDANSRIVFS